MPATTSHDPLWGRLTYATSNHLSREDARLLPPLSIRYAPLNPRRNTNNYLYRRAVAGRIWSLLRQSHPHQRQLPRIAFPQTSCSGVSYAYGFIDLVFQDEAAHHAALHSLLRFEVDVGGKVNFEQVMWCGSLPRGLFTLDCVAMQCVLPVGAEAKLRRLASAVGVCAAVTLLECRCCTGRLASPTSILRAWFRPDEGEGEGAELLKGLPPNLVINRVNYPLVLSGVRGIEALSPWIAATKGGQGGWRGGTKRCQV
ncbi:hypothetical protein BDZ90DRAFT_92643 [Jaminaea rosea]|uniref:Uncharacterized protein n=1 Tax=Jaminaea rosea TaxID=1569628 RepID=A0A316UL77_9BASI|nr:hypothetical protein BDZ90DRAFT_92643 [Jaminaea rosea]PWN24673.1 hypothetical protein BDZ90DRAFT_92643 [Jaminaea rosea]